MTLLEKNKEVLKWFPDFPSALRQSASKENEEIKRKTEFISGLSYKKRLIQLREEFRNAKSRKSKNYAV